MYFNVTRVHFNKWLYVTYDSRIYRRGLSLPDKEMRRKINAWHQSLKSLNFGIKNDLHVEHQKGGTQYLCATYSKV